VERLNVALEASKAKCKRFSWEEFQIGLGLIVRAAEYSRKGVGIFGGKKGVKFPSFHLCRQKSERERCLVGVRRCSQ